jgi:proteasome beta subunit
MSMYFGATAVGVTTKEGVIVGTDRRVAYGTFVMSRNAKKIFLFDKRIAVAFSGLYGDMSGLYRMLDAEYKYMRLVQGRDPSVYSVAKRLSIILYSYKVYPFLVEAIVAGLDTDGRPKLYTLDSLGSITEEPFIAVGSGASMALGLLEEAYREDLTVEEAIKLVYRALRAAIERDASTGDGIDIVAITREGLIERSYKLKLVEG